MKPFFHDLAQFQEVYFDGVTRPPFVFAAGTSGSSVDINVVQYSLRDVPLILSVSQILLDMALLH